jgi:hypothetical protein
VPFWCCQIRTVTVNETASEAIPVPEDPNHVDHPDQLYTEAGSINESFCAQVVKPGTRCVARAII